MKGRRAVGRIRWMLWSLLVVCGACSSGAPATDTTASTTTMPPTTTAGDDRARAGGAVPVALRAALGSAQRVDSFTTVPSGGWLVSLVDPATPCAPQLIRLQGSTRVVLGTGFNPRIDAAGTHVAVAVPDIERAGAACSAGGVAVLDAVTGERIAIARAGTPNPLVVPAFAVSDPIVFGYATDFDQFELGRLYLWKYREPDAQLIPIEVAESDMHTINSRLDLPSDTRWYADCVVDDGSHGYSLRLRGTAGLPGARLVLVGFDVATMRLRADQVEDAVTGANRCVG